MKLFPLLAAAALTLGAAPAQAQWQGGASQQAATAYCASRAAGNDHAKADRDTRWMLANSVGGGFVSEMATVLTSGRQMMQTTAYTIKQMCPEYVGGAPVVVPGWGTADTTAVAVPGSGSITGVAGGVDFTSATQAINASWKKDVPQPANGGVTVYAPPQNYPLRPLATESPNGTS